MAFQEEDDDSGIFREYGLYVFLKCYFTTFDFHLELESYDLKQTQLRKERLNLKIEFDSKCSYLLGKSITASPSIKFQSRISMKKYWLSLYLFVLILIGCNRTQPKYPMGFLGRYMPDGEPFTLALLVPYTDSSYIIANVDALWIDYSINRLNQYPTYPDFIYSVMNTPGTIDPGAYIWHSGFYSEPVVFHKDSVMEHEFNIDYDSFLRRYCTVIEEDNDGHHLLDYVIRSKYKYLESYILKMCFDKGLFIHSFFDFNQEHDWCSHISNYYVYSKNGSSTYFFSDSQGYHFNRHTKRAVTKNKLPRPIYSKPFLKRYVLDNYTEDLFLLIPYDESSFLLARLDVLRLVFAYRPNYNSFLDYLYAIMNNPEALDGLDEQPGVYHINYITNQSICEEFNNNPELFLEKHFSHKINDYEGTVKNLYTLSVNNETSMGIIKLCFDRGYFIHVLKENDMEWEIAITY